MADTNIGGALEKIEEYLKANPPKLNEALKDLEEVLKVSGIDPRANLYQALALALTGAKEKAVPYAQLAARVSQDIHQEAQDLLNRLPRK